ncbi:hypothetical protein CANARDRAFT_30453 [[Candida] arabinofermentans NRRL YB-2248]|uniref:Endoribonuclease YSH1 n=1 Tax=[Candida] arabinofermentans NRRL YB-2248 TaxID=983967 RepID=A0A1E4STZ4_9ASCO|nr:hypothetical protein CANARDRAFT_30453 [[Candida] arabinofermentans NRRL YB-2248]
MSAATADGVNATGTGIGSGTGTTAAADDDYEKLNFYCLGGGNEVGRSCHIVEYRGKVVMLDAGVHPAYSGVESLPYYDDFDLSKVDVLLISHFHLDHAASLPYVMQHTGFKGRVFMTYPTKAIYKWLLNDFVRVTSITDSNGGSSDDNSNTNSFLYTDDDLNESLDRIETIDYHSTIEVEGIRFTAFHAGHVLGAAMFFVELGGLKFLFTGDYSREEDRHLSSAELPPSRPDLLITEATFGTATHVPRIERESALTTIIHSTIQQGGRCLLPVFALGRAQEILLILDEYWQNNKDLQKIPIYYASDLAKKCMAVYQRYVNMMNDNIRKRFTETNTNPFHFKYIKNITNIEKMDDLQPSVMIASPGMLQNGISRRILERWCPDPRNSLIMTGYSVEGTMAKTILTEPTEIPSIQNPDIMIPRKMNVEEISFAAHVDYEQNSKFIELVDPKAIILVHGESNPMGRLKSALLSKYQKLKNTEDEVKVYSPRNGSKLTLQFKGKKIAKVMGQLATKLPKEHDTINGVLVQKDFDLSLLKIEDLREFSGLTTTIVKQRQSLRCDANKHLINWQLSQMFGFVKVLIDTEDEEDEEDDEYVVEIMSSVKVTLEHKIGIVTVEWNSGMVDDTIADSVIAILMSCDSSPASVKLSSKSCNHNHNHSHNGVKSEEKEEEIISNEYSTEERLNRIGKLFEVQFGDSFSNHLDENYGIVKIGKNEAKIDYITLKVQCSSGALRGRVEGVLKRSLDLVAPLSLE